VRTYSIQLFIIPLLVGLFSATAWANDNQQEFLVQNETKQKLYVKKI
jgi:hypothetical protein